MDNEIDSDIKFDLVHQEKKHRTRMYVYNLYIFNITMLYIYI